MRVVLLLLVVLGARAACAQQWPPQGPTIVSGFGPSKVANRLLGAGGSSTTTTTTTTVASTTTTTVAPQFDTFNRVGPALGANWTAPYILASTPTIINSSGVVGGASTSGAAYWTTTLPGTALYACTLIANPTTNGFVGPCLAAPTGPNDMVCCYYVGPTTPAVSLSSWDNSSQTDAFTGVAVGTTQVYLGLLRTDATHFGCFTSDGASAWAQAGTTQTIANIGTTSSGGFIAGFNTTNADMYVDGWQAGQGALPVPASKCGTGNP